ncbi:unnamed protein product, partial [Candidula unifasciata]
MYSCGDLLSFVAQVPIPIWSLELLNCCYCRNSSVPSLFLSLLPVWISPIDGSHPALYKTEQNK